MNQYSTAQLIGEIVKRLEAHEPECICDHCDEPAGLPTDDDALAFVAAMAMGGTGEFTPVQDHELDDDESVCACECEVVPMCTWQGNRADINLYEDNRDANGRTVLLSMDGDPWEIDRLISHLRYHLLNNTAQ